MYTTGYRYGQVKGTPMPNAPEVIGPHRRLDHEPGDNTFNRLLLSTLIFGTLKHGDMQVSCSPMCGPYAPI
ncbi:hypothetical protein VN97_g11721 [Penicillium thymicola]|uniref:Uncharacterized protein n=1 Tax=Penicillium thymicola TaxID=293382 RepID=A0AAI9T6P8_PENTH|nr:hypothetical protein VN97_g11721 [Penicillium thymicola]